MMYWYITFFVLIVIRELVNDVLVYLTQCKFVFWRFLYCHCDHCDITVGRLHVCAISSATSINFALKRDVRTVEHVTSHNQSTETKTKNLIVFINSPRK